MVCNFVIFRDLVKLMWWLEKLSQREGPEQVNVHETNNISIVSLKILR